MSILKVTDEIRVLMVDAVGSGGLTYYGGNSTLYPGFAADSSVDTTKQSGIKIMKGAIPTESELELAYITWDRFSGSPSDILVASNTGQRTYFDGSTGEVTWGVQAGIATQSGTATWWIWHGQGSYDPQDRGAAPGAPDNTRLACIVGTITEFGGSPLGDLVLKDTNIIAGRSYDFGPAYFSIVREWSW